MAVSSQIDGMYNLDECSSRSGHWPRLRLAFSVVWSARHGWGQAPGAIDRVHPRSGPAAAHQILRQWSTSPAWPSCNTNPH